MNMQEIPKPVIYSVAALLLIGIVAAVIMSSNSGEIPNKNKIEVGQQAVPKYLLDKMSPEMRAKAEAQSKQMGTVTEKATQAGEGAGAGGKK